MRKLILAALLLTHCHCAGGTHYEGTLAGQQGESGTIHFSVPDTSGTSLIVTGSIRLTSAKVDLTGTFIPESQALSLSGSGYHFTGTLASDALTGTYSGPRGTGSFAAQSAARSKVTLYCGTFTGGLATGVWDLSVGSEGVSTGSYSLPDGTAGVVLGTLAGDQISVTCGPRCSAKGTLSSAHGSGTWDMAGETGTWTSLDDCP